MDSRRVVEPCSSGGRWRLALWFPGLLGAIGLLTGGASVVWSAPPSVPHAEAEPSISEPVAPLPLASAEDPARVALGERLFGDARLSRDRSMSCLTCHQFDRGGADGLPVARRADGTLLSRNTPTIFNVGFNYFW